MSLFGDSDDPPAARSAAKSSLFDDDTAQAKSGGGSMFADDTAGADNSSPWGFTPRKNNGRRDGSNAVKTLLADANLPDVYVDSWDEVARGRSSIDAEDARDLLKRSGVGNAENKIWAIVTSNGSVSSIGRGEFNVLLALVALAQIGEDLSLDSVDERKKSLPVPNLPSLRKEQDAAHDGHNGSKQNGRSTFGSTFADSDPWGSPALHKGHDHSNGPGNTTPHRTTSTFTTSATDPGDDTSAGGFASQSGASNTGGSWGAGSYNPTQSGFGASGEQAGGFDAGGGDEGAGAPRRPVQPSRVHASKGQDEVITVTLLEEKEGMFMFQHRNYEVASIRRNSKVIRRYSDFVWLLDCLHKRYPFRQLPLLPPKRVAINGNHLASDNLFLEKRRRGLVRFANALVRHPSLREEQLVIMFLTVPTELSIWRKQATISVQEEFVGRTLSPTLEDSLPQSLGETFESARTGVRRGAELYINLCNLVERLVKRSEAIAGEYGRFSMNLSSITETSEGTYAIDTNDVPLLNEGIKSTAKHVGTSRTLLEDESRAWDQGFLEDVKSVRDAFVSMRELFDRKDRLARDNIPQLERRIQQNEQKLQNIKAKGDAAKPGEAEKVENAIVNDKQSIVDQHARGIFIKETVRDELQQFQTSIYSVSRLLQDWAQERVKYAELFADNFRAMVDSVESMPLGD